MGNGYWCTAQLYTNSPIPTSHSLLPSAHLLKRRQLLFTRAHNSIFSEGLERVFSSFGMIHSKLRNRLGNNRVMKLVRTYCHLRDKRSDDDDNLSLLEDFNETDNSSQ